MVLTGVRAPDTGSVSPSACAARVCGDRDRCSIRPPFSSAALLAVPPATWAWSAMVAGLYARLGTGSEVGTYATLSGQVPADGHGYARRRENQAPGCEHHACLPGGKQPDACLGSLSEAVGSNPWQVGGPDVQRGDV